MKFRATAALFGATVVAALGVGLTATAAQAADPVPIPGKNYEIVADQGGPTGEKCVDVVNGSTAPGAPLQVFHCHGFDRQGAPQLFQFFTGDRVGDIQYYQILNANSHRCISTPDGSKIQQEDCNGFQPEEWRLQDESFGGLGAFALVNEVNHECLSRGGNPAFPSDHDPLLLSPCTLAGNQIWILG